MSDLDRGMEYLSVAEAAQRLAVHENTIRSWVKLGRLTNVSPSRRIRIPREEIEALASRAVMRPHTPILTTPRCTCDDGPERGLCGICGCVAEDALRERVMDALYRETYYVRSAASDAENVGRIADAVLAVVREHLSALLAADELSWEARAAHQAAVLAPVIREAQEQAEAERLSALDATEAEIRDLLDRSGGPRPFLLVRDVDVTGVSGTGVVAEGVEYTSGTVALEWTSQWPTSVVFHQNGVESVLAIHGHGGATRIEWL